MKRKAPTAAVEAVKVTKSKTVDSPGAVRELTTTAPKRHACIMLCLLDVLLFLCCPALLTLFGFALWGRSRKEVKSAKLAKRKPNYSLVQVGGTACLERPPHLPPAVLPTCLLLTAGCRGQVGSSPTPRRQRV